MLRMTMFCSVTLLAAYCMVYSLALKVEIIHCFETSVNFYYTTECHTPEIPALLVEHLPLHTEVGRVRSRCEQRNIMNWWHRIGDHAPFLVGGLKTGLPRDEQNTIMKWTCKFLSKYVLFIACCEYVFLKLRHVSALQGPHQGGYLIKRKLYRSHT
jgi:hypothetical protein